MKSSHGTFAAIVWIVAGALLYNTEPEARAHFVADTRLFPGGYVCRVRAVRESILHHRSRCDSRARQREDRYRPNATCRDRTHRDRYVLFALEAVLIYLIARWVVRVMFV